MDYQTRSISLLDRDGNLKHYGIAAHDRVPRPALVAAIRRVAHEVIPDGASGFTIAHDGASAGFGFACWWANENELHRRMFVAPLDDPAALELDDGSAMACVWELEVIDFERRAWLEDVLKAGDVGRYHERALEEMEL
jgi:hypothetical protein